MPHEGQLMGLRLTKAADYAVVAMIHLACLPEDAVEQRGDIAAAHDIPSVFMAKVLRSLVKAKLLRSNRGAQGGFSLARSASEITLLDIVEAVEGSLGLTDCSDGSARCARSATCSAQPLWISIQTRMADLLRGTTLEDVVSAPHRKTIPLTGRPTSACESRG
jgi:Rrf2 family protein